MSDQRVVERLFQLERYVEGLQTEIAALKNVAAPGRSSRQVRIAEVVNSPVGAADNTFDIIFVDGRFNEYAGEQNPTFRRRQNASHAVAHNLGGAVIPIGTRLPVYQWNDRWWCDWRTGGETPPPVNLGDLEWQHFSSHDSQWYNKYDSTDNDWTLPFYGGKAEGEGILIEWKEPSFPALGYGNKQLVTHHTGKDNTFIGNLELIYDGSYLILFGVRAFAWSASTARTYPNPQETTGLVLDMRYNYTVAEGGTITSAIPKEMGVYPVQLTANMFDQPLEEWGFWAMNAQAWIIHGVMDNVYGNRRRLTFGCRLRWPVTDFGFGVHQSNLTIVRLPWSDTPIS